MNIFEMLSFDFQEFVTSPAGILIIVGIIFLLVGIVIFLKEGKKNTKQVEEIKEDIKPVEAQPAVSEVKNESEPVAAPAIEPVVVKATEDGINEVPVPTVTDTLNIEEQAPAVSVPTEEIKVESLDTPVETVAPVAPVIEPPVVEAPAPVAPAFEAPVIEAPTPAAPEAPVVEPVVEKQPTVYGGVSPEVGNVTIEEKPREIYGGANPLENTAPIPTVAVSTPTPEPQAPVVEAPAPVAPAFEAPVAPAPEPVAPAMAPSFEAPVAEAPVAPAIEPPKEEIEKLEF